MKNDFTSSKELALLNLYKGYLVDSGIDAEILPAQNSESLDLLQVNLVYEGNLNILFVPLGEENYQSLSLLQFFVQWDQVNRSVSDSLRLINELNQKIPMAKVSLNLENTLEYQYYLPVSAHIPLSKEEFLERVSLLLSQIEVIYKIWLQDKPINILIDELNQY